MKIKNTKKKIEIKLKDFKVYYEKEKKRFVYDDDIYIFGFNVYAYKRYREASIRNNLTTYINKIVYDLTWENGDYSVFGISIMEIVNAFQRLMDIVEQERKKDEVETS